MPTLFAIARLGVRRNPKVLRAAAALAVTGAVGLTACSSGGASHATPISSVQSAIQELGKQSSLQMSFSLPITPAQWDQVNSAGSGTGLLPQNLAKGLSQRSTFLIVQTGHGEAITSAEADTDAANAYAVGMNIGSNTPIDIRYVGQNLYVLCNIDQLANDYGLPASIHASIKQSLKQSLNRILPIIPGLNALLDGRWVKIPHASVQQILSLLKATESRQFGGSFRSVPQARQSVQRLMDQVATILKNGTDVNQIGNTGGETHYTATLHINTVFSQLELPVEQFLSSLGSKASAARSLVKSGWASQAAKIPPNTTAVVDLYTQSGDLAGVSIDVNQFATGKNKVSFPLPETLKFSSPPILSAPTGATPINLSNLPSILQQLSRRSSSSS